MSKVISEMSFEDSIEATLAGDVSFAIGTKEKRGSYGKEISNGYVARSTADYDQTLCLIPDDVINFIYATQPKEWSKLKQHYGADIKEKFLKLVYSEIEKRGTLDVMRKGVKDTGCKFKLAYFKPVSGLNEELRKLYEGNIFTVIRQLAYSEKTGQSLDLSIFINGLPIFTAELKNPLTGQSVGHAIAQYKVDRDPRELLFKFGRCLAHFAIDPDQAFMTTHLRKAKTEFLPFNKGWNNGAGNPPSVIGYSTAYLWEQIWTKDSILNLIQNFIQEIELEDDKGRKTGHKAIIFPRYHQLDSVRRLIDDSKSKGTGQRYLVEHSAGSGKSNSIAWLSHQLSVLHNADDKPVFDSVVVITDRKVLDQQLQRTVQQFEQVLGVVENIDKSSRQLKEALEDGKKIIVSTIQKYGVIVDQISELSGKHFAIIIDEAHSSQSGESSHKLKQVLSVATLEEAEREDSLTDDDIDDPISAIQKTRGQLSNASYYAFTATPKAKTLELFGTKRVDGKFEPFSLYSMRQAIEEHFIMDVLQNYTTYTTYWRLLKTVEDDPQVDKVKAKALLRYFVEHHPHNIAKKVEIIVEHFQANTSHRIGGKAKAMIVTRSRKHAVRYQLAMEKYLKEKGLPYRCLVAFSGTVNDEGIDYTEAGINGFSDSKTAATFKQDEYRFLIVANKFQTGFDQPLLHTMYVDKILGGINAVQTLSRLNRICTDKEETMVLDFANSSDDIQKAFQPYYEKTILSEGTDPHKLYDLEKKLEDFGLYTEDDINCVAEILFGKNPQQEKLYAAVVPVQNRFKLVKKDEQVEFYGTLRDYVRLYSFLSQIISFTDPELEKLYVFARILLRRLKLERGELPKEIEQDVDLESYRPQYMGTDNLKLTQQQTELAPIPNGNHKPSEEVKEALSVIIDELNDRFGANLTEDDKIVIRRLQENLRNNPALEATVHANPPDDARLTFDLVVDDELQKIINSNFEFYKRVNDNKELGKAFGDWLFQNYISEAKRSKGKGKK
jgi:type I restriction enzyme R subunit